MLRRLEASDRLKGLQGIGSSNMALRFASFPVAYSMPPPHHT